MVGVVGDDGGMPPRKGLFFSFQSCWVGAGGGEAPREGLLFSIPEVPGWRYWREVTPEGLDFLHFRGAGLALVEGSHPGKACFFAFQRCRGGADGGMAPRKDLLFFIPGVPGWRWWRGGTSGRLVFLHFRGA